MDMTPRILSKYSLIVIVGLFLFLIQAQANEWARVSGSYRLLEKTALGAQTRVQLQIHLTNHEGSDLHIQRLTLWDFSHPEKGGRQVVSIVVRAGGSANATQEFIIPRAEYELWNRGTRPRLVLEVESRGGRTTTRVVRLERDSSGRQN
jgi:hypothetical protein